MTDVFQRTVELLKRDGGARVPEIAEELGISEARARDAVGRVDDEYELGSSPDFRYGIIED